MATRQWVCQFHIPLQKRLVWSELKWQIRIELMSLLGEGGEFHLHAFINLNVPSNKSVDTFLLLKNEMATARYMEMRRRGGIVPQ